MTCNLLEFVGRQLEIELFAELLAEGHYRLLLLQGDGGIGKSCLLHRLRRDCRRERSELTTAMLDFRLDRSLASPKQVIDGLRDQLSEEFDQQMMRAEAQVARDYSAGSVESAPALAANAVAVGAPGQGGISFGGNVTAQDIIVGQKVIINNSTLILNPGAGLDLLEAEIEQRRNRAMRRALLDLVRSEQVMIFVDHFEEAPEPVRRWLIQQLLNIPLVDEDLCENLWIVVSGKQVPYQDQIDQWRHLLRFHRLPPLSNEEIQAFWIDKRQLDPAQVMVIALASGGNPGLLFMMANNMQNATRKDGPRD
ncbi:AAA family ATPase [bacterium]|nr:AAA family ATPase [bacterium]